MPKTKPNQISYWYPVRTVGQLAFDGKTIFHDVPQEGHILYQGRLLCKQSMERLKHECAAKKHKISTTRIQGAKLCESCQEKYKENENLDWAHWVNGKELKHEATVKISPEFLRGINDGPK